MTRIDFHVNVADKVDYACRLVRKVHAAGQSMLLYSANAHVLSDMDDALWSFSPVDFLPHCRANDPIARTTPILLSDHDVSNTTRAVLINLDAQQPSFFSRFERMLEIVGDDENELVQGRNRWKFYKDRGYELTRHDAGVRAQ